MESANVRCELRFMQSLMDFCFEYMHSSINFFSRMYPSCLALSGVTGITDCKVCRTGDAESN